MKRRKVVYGFLSLAALAAVIFGATFGLAGCGRGSTVSATDMPVSCQADERVFTLFAGLNMGGYDVESGSAMDPIRTDVREALASADDKLVATFRSLLLQSTPEQLSLMAVKDIGDPPGFGIKQTYGMLPDLSAALSALWEGPGETLANDEAAGLTEEAEALAGEATEKIRAVLAYCHEENSPLESVDLVVNPLASHGFACFFLDDVGRKGYIVVGPDDEERLDAVVHQFVYLTLGNDLFRQLELDGKLNRFTPVRDRAKAIPLINSQYSSLQGFVEDCLVRAIGVKVMGGGQADIDKAYDAGFLLTPALYEALASFEAGDSTLIDAIPGLLAGLDVDSVVQLVDSQPPTGQ